jgi:glyoxylase-like metal-dependent hydrolase (beta-lactamase superfamily II)
MSTIYPLSQRQGIYVHAFLIDTGQPDIGLILIDTLYSEDAKLIFDQIKAIGKTPTDLKHILLTHAHRAHMGGLAALKMASGAKVYCHEWEADIVEGDRRIQFVTFKPLPPYRIWPFQVASYFSRHKPCKVDELIHEGDRVGPLHVVYAPGHSPGHLAFYWPERNALFAGDTLVSYPNFAVGWAGFMLNFKQNHASLRRMADFGAEYLGVGHGDPIAAGGAKMLRDLVSTLPKP